MGSKPTSRPKHFLDRASLQSGPPRHSLAEKPPAVEAQALVVAQRKLFAGTSGWAYPTWKPGFYPAKLAAKKFLSFYAMELNSVEVNYTFTKLPTPSIVDDWLRDAPESFRFSFKAPQRITHFKRLIDCEEPLNAFLAAIKPALDAGKIGLILFQLPPNFKADPIRLRNFLDLPCLKSSPPIAFEFRHESWFVDDIKSLLSEYNAALCVAESDKLQSPEWHTAAAHTCFRLRRDGGYKPRQLASFAQRFTDLAKTRDVYAYFKHEDEPTGALNARALRKAAARKARS